MAQKMHLIKAPIKEALIDLKIRGGKLPSAKGVDVNTLFAGRYPRVETINHRQFDVQFGTTNELVTTTLDKELGFRAFSEDGLQVAQFREDGFTFSRLAPYESWEDFLKEAQRLWALYLDLAKPEFITRVAVRYINELRLPLPLTDFNEYLVSPPDVPDGLPQGLSSFLTRLVIPNPEINAVAIVTQALDGASAQFATIILDIDVFQDTEVDIGSNTYWQTLKDLRDYKNNIFFKSITEKAKELYI